MIDISKVENSNLRIVKGKLVHKDGLDVEKYLRKWARTDKIKADDPIFIIAATDLRALANSAIALSACDFCGKYVHPGFKNGKVMICNKCVKELGERIEAENKPLDTKHE